MGVGLEDVGGSLAPGEIVGEKCPLITTQKMKFTKTENSVCVTGDSQPCTLVIQTTRRMKMTIFLEAIAYGAIGAIVVLILQATWGAWND
jgi:hypothetical protein